MCNSVNGNGSNCNCSNCNCSNCQQYTPSRTLELMIPNEYEFSGSRRPMLRVPSRVGNAIVGISSRSLSQGQPMQQTSCTQLDRFAFNSDRPTAAHLARIKLLAKQIVESQKTSSSVRQVAIVGHTDVAGSEAYNVALGRRRAERVSAVLKAEIAKSNPSLLARLEWHVSSKGESKPISRKPDENRRVEVCAARVSYPTPSKPSNQRPTKPASATETNIQLTTVKLVAKSFINIIGSKIGPLPCAPGLISSTVVGTPSATVLKIGELKALAAITDLSYHENPTTDRQDGIYRLFSELSLEIKSQSGTLLSVNSGSGIITDVGKECDPGKNVCLVPPSASTVPPLAIRRTGPSTANFFWRIKSRPNRIAEQAFQVICERDAKFIWHFVSGSIDCSKTSPIIKIHGFQGSQFPSHRLFLNGTLIKNIPQGNFTNLWISDPADSSLVR
jgi:outer membrane protein OmpA-like peptidoglycan-associated protein